MFIFLGSNSEYSMCFNRSNLFDKWKRYFFFIYFMMFKLEIKISLVIFLVELIECYIENEICFILNDVWIENVYFYLIFCFILLIL